MKVFQQQTDDTRPGSSAGGHNRYLARGVGAGMIVGAILGEVTQGMVLGAAASLAFATLRRDSKAASETGSGLRE